MTIGVPKEIELGENRVATIPQRADILVAHHRVFVEEGTGEGSGFSEQEYQKNGAILVERGAHRKYPTV